MRWYNADAGVWSDNNGGLYWWQSANMMSAFNDLAALDANVKSIYASVWDSSFSNAPAHNPSPSVKELPNGRLVKVYEWPSPEEVHSRNMTKRVEVGFTNDFYDDEGWWALAWLGAYDNTGDIKYLNEAIDIWYDMKAGWNKHPCGGLPWNKSDGSVPVAISNGKYSSSVLSWKTVIFCSNASLELYIYLGAALTNRVGDDQKPTYLGAAQEAWTWFQNTGMINSDSLINDGIDGTTCKNNGFPTYSYNQGVILGALTELYRATNDGSYLDSAAAIADAVTATNGLMTTANGILVDGCDRDMTCSGDGVQFKGVVPRNLKKLQAARPSDQWKAFLETNAQSVWNNDLNVDAGCKNGVYWAGPYATADASSQSSALDCINAALAVTS